MSTANNLELTFFLSHICDTHTWRFLFLECLFFASILTKKDKKRQNTT